MNARLKRTGLRGPAADSNAGRVLSPAWTYGAASLGTLVLAWVWATEVTEIVPEIKLPSPFAVFEALQRLAVQPFGGTTLSGHVLASLERWGIGVALAVAVAVPLGVLIAWIPMLARAVNPVFEFLRYIPPIAWIPLAVLWFGASTTSQALIVFIAAVPPSVINSALGIRQLDPLLSRAAAMLGASSTRTLWRVALPSAAPAIFAGLRISIGNGWMALVGAELIAGTTGLGFLIIAGQNNGDSSTIVAGMACIGVIGSLVDALLRWQQRRLLPWKTERREAA